MAGIAIAALVGVVILAAVLFFFIRRQRQKAAYKVQPPGPDTSVLSGPVHNPFPPEPPSSDPSAPQDSFWSPDTVQNGSGHHNGGSSGDGINNENSADERGMELDGHGTQVQPVYHELGGRELLKV